MRKRIVPLASFLIALAVIYLFAQFLWIKSELPAKPIQYRYLGAPMVGQRPAGEPTTLVIIVAPVWQDPFSQDIAERLLAEGAAVVTVALPDAVSLAGVRREGCVDLGRVFHAIAKDAEDRLAFTEYRVPLLAGVDLGALAALLGYRQSRSGTWTGLLTVDRKEELELPLEPCFGLGTPGSKPSNYVIDSRIRDGQNWVDFPEGNLGRFVSLVNPLLSGSTGGNPP